MIEGRLSAVVVRSRQGGAVPGQRRFFLYLGRQFVRRWRRLGDGPNMS